MAPLVTDSGGRGGAGVWGGGAGMAGWGAARTSPASPARTPGCPSRPARHPRTEPSQQQDIRTQLRFRTETNIVCDAAERVAGPDADNVAALLATGGSAHLFRHVPAHRAGQGQGARGREDGRGAEPGLNRPPCCALRDGARDGGNGRAGPGDAGTRWI